MDTGVELSNADPAVCAVRAKLSAIGGSHCVLPPAGTASPIFIFNHHQ